MKVTGKQVGFWVSVLLFLVIVPYSVIEWFDKSIPFSPSLYLLSGLSAMLLFFNSYRINRD